VLRVSLKPRDSSHPYGHGKFESLGALIISGLLVGTGVGIGWQSVEHMQLILAGKSLGTPTGIALVGAVISIAVKELVYQSTMKVGERYDSKVIKANAWHHRSDAISSVVALIGVVGGMLQVPIVDPVAGLFVSALIVKAAVELGWDSLKDLTDQNVSPRVIAQVEKLLAELKADGVVGWHQLRGRRMGPYMILDVHILVDPKLSVTASHQIAEKVRVKIVNAMPAVSEVLVHIDPAGEEMDGTLQRRRTQQQHSADTSAQRSPPSSGPSSSSPTQSRSHPHSHSELVDDDVSHSHHHTGDERDSPALSHALQSSSAESSLMRPQQEIEADVRAVLQQPAFDGKVLALTHFTCHFLNGRLCCQLELVMQETLTVGQAREVAREVDARVRAAVADVDSVDVHLELNGSHISQATNIQRARVGDTQQHMNTAQQEPQDQR
jgi:cation diffusion facilitator family transporter